MAIFISEATTSRIQTEWQAFNEVGGAPNKGARLAIEITDEKATILFVDVDANGSIAMHAQPERSVCYIVEGEGSIMLSGQPDVPYAKGDLVTFDPSVLHGWRNGARPTRILVAVLP